MSVSHIHSPSQVVRILEEDISESFRVGIAKAIVQSYKEANLRCAGVRDATKRDMVGHVRRGLMEAALFSEVVAGGGVAEDDSNRNESSNFVRGKLGRCVVTQHAVNDVGELPRDSLSRTTMAREAQVEMFAKAEPPPPDASLYVQINFGPRNGTFPGFLTLTVPNEGCDEIVARVSLYKQLLEARLQDIADSSGEKLVAQEEVVPDAVSVVLRAAMTIADPDAAEPTATEKIPETQLSLLDLLRRKSGEAG
jgi:hypothetical protein